MEDVIKLCDTNFKVNREQGRKIFDDFLCWYHEEKPDLEGADLSHILKLDSVITLFDEILGYELEIISSILPGYELEIITGVLSDYYKIVCKAKYNIDNEPIVFGRMAKFLKEGTYFRYFNKENGNHFRYIIKGGQCILEEAKITFD